MHEELMKQKRAERFARAWRQRIYREKPKVPSLFTRAVQRKRHGLSRTSPDMVVRIVTETPKKRWSFVGNFRCSNRHRLWWPSAGAFVRRSITHERDEPEPRELKPRPPTPKRNPHRYERCRARAAMSRLLSEYE